MSDIELAGELRNLAANPVGDAKAEAYELLRLVCQRLRFTIGVYARVDRRARERSANGLVSYHLQTVYPGRIGLGGEALVALEQWLQEHVQAADRWIERTDLAETMPDHPFHETSGCRCFIGVPVSDGGVLAGVFGFFHTKEMESWSPFAEHTVGIMMAWFVERMSRSETGFSMLPAAELEQPTSLAGLELFRSTTQQFVMVMDLSGYLLEGNRALMKFEDKGPEGIRGTHLCDLSFSEYLVGGDSVLRGAIREANRARSAHRELVMDRRGEGRTFQCLIKRVTHPHSGQVLLLGEILELTEYFRAIRQFEAQEDLLKAVFNHSTNFIGLLEPDGSLIVANQRTLDFVGKTNEQLRGGKLWDLPWFFDMEASKNRLREAVAEVAAGGTVRFELLIKGEESQVMPIEFTCKPLFDDEGKVMFLLPEGHDLTPQIAELNDRIMSERELQKEVRLHSLGVLCGGVAHDFNNLLTCILGNASLLKMETPNASENYVMLQEIESAARRSATLCQQMLAFSGNGRISMQPSCLSKLVDDQVPDLLTRLGYSGVIDLDLDETLPEVLVDERQIVQLLVDVVTNAIEAMQPEKGNGVLAIRTSLLVEPNLSHVVLEVADNGCGMEELVRARACEPFFSTKFTGRGLGLAAVSGIVRGHQGRLDIESSTSPGGVAVTSPAGTIVRVTLPLPLSKSPSTLASSPRLNTSAVGSVLVVDDDRLVQGVVSRFLTILGYTSILASDGVEAVDACKNGRDEIVLVVLDLTMPRMDGYQAFNELRRINPRLPVVLMSGYSERQSVLRFEENLAGFLPKPLTFESVKECLKSVLGEAPRS